MTKPGLFEVNLNARSTVNGNVKYGVGIFFPKGMYLVINYLNISKDGIAALLESWDILVALAARLVGLFDALLTTLIFPFLVLTYALLFVLGIVSWFFTWPVYLVAINRTSAASIRYVTYMKLVGIGIPLSISSIIIGAFALVLSYLQILVPELTCYVFQLHKWGEEL